MIKYCKRCLYPSNGKPTIIFDEEGICSGCRYHEKRQNWKQIGLKEKNYLMILFNKQLIQQKIKIHTIVLYPLVGEKTLHFRFGI